MDRRYVVTSFVYAIAGLLLGIYMAASRNHGQFDTHSHVLLVGFVVSFVYALIHKVWLGNETTKLAMLQYLVHQAGSLGLFGGLFLLHGRLLPVETLGPVLGLSSILVLAGMVLMMVMYLKTGKRA